MSGPEYLSAQFNYYPTDAWRNFGIILCFWVGYTILQGLAQAYMTKRGEGGISGRVYKRGAVIPGDTEEVVHKSEKELDVEAQSRSPSLRGQGRPNDSSGSMTQVEDGTASVNFDAKVSSYINTNWRRVTKADGSRLPSPSPTSRTKLAPVTAHGNCSTGSTATSSPANSRL